MCIRDRFEEVRRIPEFLFNLRKLTPGKLNTYLFTFDLYYHDATVPLIVIAPATPPAAASTSSWGSGTLTDAELWNLIGQMTLAEKSLMIRGSSDTTCATANISPSVQGCQGQAGTVAGVARLGIPPLRLTDGPAGIRLSGNYNTALPAPVGLAASFSRENAYNFGLVMGKEGRATNQEVLLAPMIAVFVLDVASSITPAALPAANLLDAKDVKQATFTAVGYGTERDSKNGGTNSFLPGSRRKVVEQTVNSVNKAWVTFSMNPSTGNGGTCYGDSGGPHFLGGANATNPTIVSITAPRIAAFSTTRGCFCRSSAIRLRTGSPA